MGNNLFTPERAEEEIKNSRMELVSFGKLFISSNK